MRTLVVDDEQVSREKINNIMKGFGFSSAVNSGQEALDAFLEAWDRLEPYDLILMDIQMPGMTGIEALKKLRDMEAEMNLPEPARVKVIMVTAMSGRQIVKEALDAGCDDYIIKPVKKSILSEKMEPLFPPELTKAWRGTPTYNGASIDAIE